MAEPATDAVERLLLAWQRGCDATACVLAFALLCRQPDESITFYTVRLEVRDGRSTPDLDFGQVERDERLSDRVANRILDAIVSRDMRPGDRLPSERELAEQFGVSRTVVREAVRSLAGKGIIDTQPGRGLSVAAVDSAAVSQSLGLYLHGRLAFDYRKLHEVRTMVEVQAAGLAAQRATDEELDDLRVVCDRMEAVLSENEAASRDDVEFHRLVAESTHNEFYELLLEAIGGPLIQIRREQFAVPGRPAVALAAHRGILRCLAARDPSGARRQMRAHLDDVERLWERVEIPGYAPTGGERSGVH